MLPLLHRHSDHILQLMPVKYGQVSPGKSKFQTNQKFRKANGSLLDPRRCMWLQLGLWVAELGGRPPGVADEKRNVEEGNGLHRKYSALNKLFLKFR